MVKAEDGFPPGDFPSPFAMRFHTIASPKAGEKNRADIQGKSAATGALRVRPGATVHVAIGLGADASVVGVQAEDIPDVVFPVREHILMVKDILGHPPGREDSLNRMLPIPVMPAPCVCDGPGRQ